MNGWEPTTSHTHVYDQEGRLVETTVRRETEWTPDDVALLMAQHELESEIGPHGQPMSEATDGRADPNFSGREWGYEAFHSTDYAAEALRLGPILLRREYPDMSDEQVERLKWGVRKVPAVPRGEERNG